MRGVSKDGRESMLCGHPSRRIGSADAPQDEGIISFTSSELDFGQYLKLPIREMPQDIEVREFLDGPGRAQDRKKFLPCPKHPQIGHN